MAKSKASRKRTPKHVLKLPDLEQSKSAVLNSLTSPSSQRTYDLQSENSSNGTVQNPGSPSIGPWSLGTEYPSNSDTTPQQRSTCVWLPSGG
jgi:hypothetical protein